jgi:hypothetical protein
VKFDLIEVGGLDWIGLDLALAWLGLTVGLS